ncbi:hypothetical protein PVAG01_10309 [Phlyctema vagabunda]|uniref:Uncharacterized protein n=1 Tax=Phlyctema vagabunda TaxID=108571 RepID=A0ABR4P5L4_9HELO
MASKSKAKQPFWLGGAASSMAACFSLPSLWTGISASVLRQTTYSTTRFGLYNYLAFTLKQRSRTAELSAASTMTCAGLAGGIAGLIGNPTEVVLVRMCTDGVKPTDQKYAYRNPIAALLRIAREEGIGTFAKGLGPNVMRSVLMNVSQIAVYAKSKSVLLATPSLGLKDTVPTHILSSLIAGTVATTVCAPADVLKSRLQSASTSKVGILPIIRTSIQYEGIGFLMKGWTPAWLRLAPNTVLMFLFMEQLQKLVGGGI